MKHVTFQNYRGDALYPRVVRAVSELLARQRTVTPVEVFQHMGLLSAEHIEAWRRGRVPFLERVIHCNLSKANRVLRILRLHAHDLDMKPVETAYFRWGRGPKQRLRFSKSRTPALEQAYSRHFVYLRRQWPPPEPGGTEEV
jgi:hypothetical protein